MQPVETFLGILITVKTDKNLNPNGKIRPFKGYHAVDPEICSHCPGKAYNLKRKSYEMNILF